MGKHALRKGLSSVNSIHRTTPVLPGRTVDAPEHIEIFDSSYAVIKSIENRADRERKLSVA